MPPATAAAATAPVQMPALRLLGQARLQRAGAADHLLERRDAALLALLVLDGPQPRGALALCLWPDATPAQALNNLRQRLFRLQRTAGAALASGTATLRLAAGLQHDLQADEFGDPGDATGPAMLLGTHQYTDNDALADRVQALRARWQQARGDALAQQADRLEAQGQHAAALRLAEQLLLHRPASEQAHRRVMRLHHLLGDPAQALAAFERCRHTLRATVDAAPGAETLALARLLDGSGSAAPPAAAGLAPVPVPALLQLALARPPQRVGRAADWLLLQQAWQRGQTVVLRGEAGSGKTRLAADFLRAQAAALPAAQTVQTVQAHAGDAALPHALLARLLQQLLPTLPLPPAWAAAELARLVPQWGTPPAAAVQALRLQQAVAAALQPLQAQPAGAGGPAVGALWLDDLQWADDASLLLLLAWLDAAGPARPPTLLSLRDGALPPPLQTWLARQPPGTVCHHRLGPLDAAGIADLLASLPMPAWPVLPALPALPVLPALPALPPVTPQHRPGWLLQHSGGRPLFVLELLRALPAAAWAPDALWGDGHVAQAAQCLAPLLQQRIGELDPLALKLLRLAALAGDAASVPLAANVLGLDALDLADGWQQLQQAQLLHGAGAVVGVVRAAVLAGVPAAVAQVLHRRIASALQRQGHAAAAVALHWQAAQCWPQAAAAFASAGQQALAMSQRGDELRCLDQAAACHARAGQPRAAWAARLAAFAPALVVASVQAVEQRLDTLLADAVDDSERADVLLARCRLRLNGGDGAGALQPARAALALAQRSGSRAHEAAAVGWQGLALALLGRVGDGIAGFETWAPDVLAQADVRLRLDFFGAMGYALHAAGRHAQALQPFAVAVACAETLGDLTDAMEQASNLMVCHGSLGDRDGAIRAGEQALQLWRRMGEPEGATVAATHVQLATHHYGGGRYAQALELLDWALPRLRKAAAPLWTVIAEHRLATVLLRLGQHARARQALRPLPAQASVGNRIARCMVEARLDHLAGKSVAAALMAACDTLAPQAEPVDRRALALLLAAHAAPAAALALCDTLLAEAPADVPMLVHTHARRGDALRLLGRHAEAVAAVRTSWALGRQSPPMDLEFVAWCGLVFRAADAGGDAATAGAALASASDWLAQARPHVPPPFLPSFDERNPHNRDVRTWLQRPRLPA